MSGRDSLDHWPDEISEENDQPSLAETLKSLATEQRLQESMHLDRADASEIVRIIYEQDAKVAHEVAKKREQLASLIEVTAECLRRGGRLLYFGAGTSGRLGVLDASECPPTFGTDPGLIQGFIAGGKEAMFRAQEGAEDLESNGQKDAVDADVNDKDMVVGLAASGRTPYVHGAIKHARRVGAATALVCTVPESQVSLQVDHLIAIPVGPEVIAGSTRMKSATAQKMVLNMVSTGVMVLRGKVYENMMVDLQRTNQKLHERAKRTVQMLTNLKEQETEMLLHQAEGHVKTALLMEWTGSDRETCKAMLEKNDGSIRNVLQALDLDRENGTPGAS